MNKIIRNLLMALLFSVSLFSVLSFKKKVYVKEINILEDVQIGSSLPQKNTESFLSPQELSRHFPDQYISQPAIVREFPQITPVADSGLQVNHNWKYISTITQSGNSIYYFKKKGSSRLLELEVNKPSGSWVLLKIESDHFILKEGGKLHKVLKK